MQKQTDELKLLNKHQEMILKKLGLESLNLNNSHLEEYAQLKLKTKLHSLEESFLDEFSCRTQAEILDEKQKCVNLETDIRALEFEIEKDSKEILELEKCLEQLSKYKNTENDLNMQKTVKEKYSQKHQDYHKNVTKTDINIDGLIEKISMVEALMEERK